MRNGSYMISMQAGHGGTCLYSWHSRGEVGGSQSLRPAWSVQHVPGHSGLHSETVSKGKKLMLDSTGELLWAAWCSAVAACDQAVAKASSSQAELSWAEAGCPRQEGRSTFFSRNLVVIWPLLGDHPPTPPPTEMTGLHREPGFPCQCPNTIIWKPRGRICSFGLILLAPKFERTDLLLLGFRVAGWRLLCNIILFTINFFSRYFLTDLGNADIFIFCYIVETFYVIYMVLMEHGIFWKQHIIHIFVYVF